LPFTNVCSSFSFGNLRLASKDTTFAIPYIYQLGFLINTKNEHFARDHPMIIIWVSIKLLASEKIVLISLFHMALCQN
jgi:hypothetical protein